MARDDVEKGWKGKEKILVGTGVVALLSWVGAWVLIYLTRAGITNIDEPTAVGASLGVVVISLFLGFYIYGGEDRMRASIAASFLVFYLLLSTNLLVIRAFRESVVPDLANDILKTLGGALTTVLAFYFVVKGVETATKTVQEQKTSRSESELKKAELQAKVQETGK
jgi:uncharacterized membrane protein YfcA